MPRSELTLLLAWGIVIQQGLCGELVKIVYQPSEVLADYNAYGYITIVHFDIPEGTVAASFKFTAKEEKIGGIGKCSARNVSLYLKSGSLPFVRPDGSKIAANLMAGRRRHYPMNLKSDSDQHSITIVAPPPGDWYAIAFRSWTNPENGKITQQGLGASCDTVLNTELSVEQPSITSLIDFRNVHEVQLNGSVDSAVLQLQIPESFDDQVLSVKSSCGSGCEVAVHVTAQDHLAGVIVNSKEHSIVFKSYANTFHYVTIRLLSRKMSTTVSVQLLNGSSTIDTYQVKSIGLIRKTLPEFFLFDYEHVRVNETKPVPFNLTADTLSVLSFEIGRIYDVGGTLSLGIELLDVEEKMKKNVFVVACVSMGYYSNITSGGSCERALNTTSADIYANATGPSFIHIPFPEPGTWHMSLRAVCVEENCGCAEKCLSGTVCGDCSCINWCSVKVDTSISSSPCIGGSCGDHGKCMHYMSGGFVFSACQCTDGYRGFDCVDDTYVLDNSKVIVHMLLLTFSNLVFIGSIYIAVRREYFTEAIVYAAVMFFSTFYHACEAGEDLYSVCIMRLSVLQFCDFFNALLSIWVTLVAMASLGPRLTAFCQIAGAVILAMGAEMDRTALWVFLLPAITGCAMIGLSWGLRCRRKKTVRYPSRPYRLIFFPAGLLIVSLGLICYAFLQTRSNYYIIHSFWHICVAVAVMLLLPKRQYMK